MSRYLDTFLYIQYSAVHHFGEKANLKVMQTNICNVPRSKVIVMLMTNNFKIIQQITNIPTDELIGLILLVKTK